MSTIRALLGGSASPSPSSSKQDTPSVPRLLSPAPLTSAPSSPAPTHATPTPTPPPPHHHVQAPALRPKPKIIKDAPVFTPSAPRGPVRFPPHVSPDNTSASSTTDAPASTHGSDTPTAATATATDADAAVDPDLSAYHAHFSLYPPAPEIGRYARHIPYNSEKRVFVTATGRDFFEVFQYTFRVPGGDDGQQGDGQGKAYAMLWDYNTGLVRTTPLFKCCGYGKTTPAKMLNKNVGLKEICHSITGGALVAQGYWIPYAAAKAIAATFCWSIRHALTPVFGTDFVDLCVDPQDPRFGSMLIDEAITVQCRAEAAAYREYELQHPTVRPTTGPGSRPASPRTPSPQQQPPRYIQPMRLPGLGLGIGISAADNCSSVSASATNSTCESDISEPDDQYAVSPTSQSVANSPASPRFRNVWTHANVPRSTPRGEIELHSPKSVMKAFHMHTQSAGNGGNGNGGNGGKAKRNFADFEEMGPGFAIASAYSSPAQSPKRGKMGWGKALALAIRMEGQEDLDGGYEADADEMEIDGGAGAAAAWGWKGPGDGNAGKARVDFGDADAAKVLLALGAPRKVTGRRASA